MTPRRAWLGDVWQVPYASQRVRVLKVAYLPSGAKEPRLLRPELRRSSARGSNLERKPVDLKFNLLGYTFQEGISRLSEGYELATIALSASVDKLRGNLDAYHAAVAAGAPRVG